MDDDAYRKLQDESVRLLDADDYAAASRLGVNDADTAVQLKRIADMLIEAGTDPNARAQFPHGEPLTPWPAYELPVGDDWTSGVHVAYLIEGDGHGGDRTEPVRSTPDAREAAALFVVLGRNIVRSGLAMMACFAALAVDLTRQMRTGVSPLGDECAPVCPEV